MMEAFAFFLVGVVVLVVLAFLVLALPVALPVFGIVGLIWLFMNDLGVVAVFIITGAVLGFLYLRSKT